MSECSLCKMMRTACSNLAEGEEGRRVCEELVDKLSKRDIDIEAFFNEMKEKVGASEEKILSEMRKEIDASKEEVKQ